MKNFWKKYGKIVAAAVFLTAAGLCYGFARNASGAVPLGAEGHPVVLETLASEDFASNNSAQMGSSTETVQTHAEPEGIYVHICGEVKNPGVYELPEGSRIFEVVEAAGGFTERAAQASQNLAQMISDGMQIVILSLEEVEEKAQAEREQADGIVNINTASKEQLMTLTGIGESRAEDILRYREESGGFRSIEEIMQVPGIKESTYQKIKDNITV